MDSFQTLISPRSLKSHLGQSGWTVVDVRFNLMKPDAGRKDYDAAHLPGAVYANLDEDLAGTLTDTTGRHPLPDPDGFAAHLGSWGVSNSTQVLVYDDAGGAIAARLWWLLRWIGHMDVAVLDGGINAWETEGFAVDDKPVTPEPVRFHPDPIRAAWLSTEDVQAMLGSASIILLDARAPERYAGTVEPIDNVAGHIPGAINMPFSGNLGYEGRFLSPADLKDRYRATIGSLDPVNVVCMCGSGVTACHDLLAMEHAGMHGGKLYVGSWSEWITNPDRPVIKE